MHVSVSKDKATGDWPPNGAGEPWSAVWRGRGVCTCTNTLIFLKAGHRGLAIGGTGESWPALRTHVSDGTVPVAGVELWALGLCVSTHQQLERLGSTGQLLG